LILEQTASFKIILAPIAVEILFLSRFLRQEKIETNSGKLLLKNLEIIKLLI